MSAPSTAHGSLSATGYTDGFGRRTLEFDRESGRMLERLHVRAEFGAFEAALRQQADCLAAFDDARFPRVRDVERDASGSLSVLSAYVAADRLCDLLEAATSLPAHEATSPSVDAALGFLLEILPALDAFHSATGLTHGAVAPGRITLTAAGQVVLVDGLFGQAHDRLQINRRRLWTEFGLAMPAVAGPPRFDRAADISQASLAAMMIVLGRPFLENDYPDALPDLITEVIEIAQIRGSSRFASDLHKFLHRTLPLPVRRAHASAEEAAAEVRQVAREIGVQRCRDALTAFVEDMNRVLSEPRGPRVPEYAGAVELRSTPEPESAFEEPVLVDLLDRSTIDEAEVAPLVEETIVASVHPKPIVVAGLAAVAEPASSLATVVELEPLPIPEPPPAKAPAPVVAAVPEAQPAAVAIVPAPAPGVAEARPAPIEPIPEPVSAIEPVPAPAPAIEPVPAPVRATEPSIAAPAATQPTLEPTPAESKRARRNARRHRDKLRSHAAPPPAPPLPARPPLIQTTPAMAAMMPLPSVPAPAPPARKIAQPLREDAPIAEPVVPLAPVRVEPPAAAPLPIAPVAFNAAPVRFKAGPASFNPEPVSFRNDTVPFKNETLPFKSEPIAFKNDQHPASRTAFRPERREPHDVRGPQFEFAREQKRTFPWRLAAAAVVVIAVGVGAGRKYLPGNEPPQPAPVPSKEVVAAAKAAEAAEKTGTVVLTTEPAGAHVLLDGKEMGDSPLTLENVPAGKHALMFVTASASVKRIIRVDTGKTVSLDVAVFSGWIAVYSPIPLDISENGRAIGSSEQGRLMLSPGRHQLTLTNTELGYRSAQNVDIEPGEERPISVQPTGELSANANPWAEVWMNGKKVGETPIAGLMVPLGTHEILFKNPQFPERRVTVTVNASRPVTASVDFSK